MNELKQAILKLLGSDMEGVAVWGGKWAAVECGPLGMLNREVAVFDTREEAEQHIHASQL